MQRRIGCGDVNSMAAVQIAKRALDQPLPHDVLE